MKDKETRKFLFEYSGRCAYFEYYTGYCDNKLSSYLTLWDGDAGYDLCLSILELHFMQNNIDIRVLGK